MLYTLPGRPNLPPPANAYRPPGASAETAPAQPPPSEPDAAPPPITPPPTPPDPDPRWSILSEWLVHHGSAWVRSDELHQQVRQLLDPQERTAAIRQRVQKLAGAEVGGLRVETQAIGNPIRHRLYRVVENVKQS
jgi:hypothetical protein